jgi:tetratricopeptide (TPR) repeat protein
MLLREAIGDFTKLTEGDPDTPAYRVHLAAIQIRLGELLAFQQRPVEAEQTYRQAIPILEKLAADFPAQPSHRSRIAETYTRLGHAILGTRPADAEKALRQAIAIYEKLATEYPGGEVVGDGLGHAYGVLAGSLDQTTKASEREQLWRQAATQFEEVLQREPASPRSPPRRFFLAATYLTLADASLAQKKTAEAETIYRRAMDQFALVTADALGRSEIDSAWRMEVLSRAHKNLMNLLAAAGRIQEAAEVCQKAIDLFTKLAEERPNEPYFREELAKRQAELAKLKEKP